MLLFKTWLEKVDKILLGKIGLSHECCRDRGFWDAWSGGFSPEEFVEEEWGDDPEEMMLKELMG